MRQDDNFPSHPGRPFSWTPGRIAESAVTDEGVTQHENETRRFVSGSFVDTSRRPFAIYRGGGVEPAGNLFKRGVDSLDDVQDSSLWGRISAGYRNGSGAVLGVYARSTQLLGDNVFQRGYHTLDDVQDSSIWGRINVGYRNTGGAVTAVLQSGVALPGDNVFKRGFHTLADVLDGGGYGRVNLSGGVYSVTGDLTASGAGTFDRAAFTGNVTQWALRFEGSSVHDIWMSGGGTFRIVNSPYTIATFSVDQSGIVGIYNYASAGANGYRFTDADAGVFMSGGLVYLARPSTGSGLRVNPSTGDTVVSGQLTVGIDTSGRDFYGRNFVAGGAGSQFTIYDRTVGSAKPHVLYADGGTGRWWVGSVGDAIQVDYTTGNTSIVKRLVAASGMDVYAAYGIKWQGFDGGVFGNATYSYFGRWSSEAGLRVRHSDGLIETTGQLRCISHIARPGDNATGHYSETVSSSYVAAAVHLRETLAGGNAANNGAGYAPRIGFHWGGIIASQIALETDGTIAIRNNPGTGYEKFKALSIRAYDDLSADGNIILNTAGKNFLNSLGHKMCPVIFSTLAPSGSAEDGTVWVQY
jgi:hypothetical protein